MNAHNKAEFPPAHTAEHLLNGTMVKMFGCPRSPRAHVERTKSKLDYPFDRPLTDDEIREVERRVNEQIARDLPVVMEFMPVEEAAREFNLERLPDDASSTVRIVRIGDYDIGVVKVVGQFEKDDIVRVVNPEGQVIALGRVGCNSAKATESAGKRGSRRPLIHTDYIYII